MSKTKGTSKEVLEKGLSSDVKTFSEESAISLVDMDNQLLVSPELVKEIKKKGLAYRWVNGIKLRNNHGFDPRQWTPYQVKKEVGGQNNYFGGTDSEGYIRRGDLILCVRLQRLNDAVKERNINRNKALAGEHRKATKEQLKQLQRDAGLSNSRITEGYDEEGDEAFEGDE